MDLNPSYSNSWDWSSLAKDFLEHSFEFERRHGRSGSKPAAQSVTSSGGSALNAESDSKSGGTNGLC